MMKRPPAFQFYARDWLSNTMGMSMHHRGIYITVKAAMWNSEEPGTLPLPIEIAARSAGLDPRSLRDFVSKSPGCLREIDGKLVDLQLRSQWEEMQQHKQKLSDAGKRGNEKRWEQSSGGDSGGDRSASAFASASASSSIQSSQGHKAEAVNTGVNGSAAAAAFTDLGFEKPFGRPNFQAIWVTHFVEAKHAGTWVTQAMEDTIQECQRLNIGVPPQFYDAKHDIEARENEEFKHRHHRTPL